MPLSRTQLLHHCHERGEGSMGLQHFLILHHRVQEAPTLSPERIFYNVRLFAYTMQDYLHQIKVIYNQLATCGAPVSEDDLIIRTLAGLSPKYHPFQMSIRTKSRPEPVSLEELHTFPVCEELSLAEDNTAESSTTFTATMHKLHLVPVQPRQKFGPAATSQQQRGPSSSPFNRPN